MQGRSRNGIRVFGCDWQSVAPPQVLLVVELFCGEGGLSYLDEGSSDRVSIQTRWAVDHDGDACATFQANHPGVQVRSLRPPALGSCARVTDTGRTVHGCAASCHRN